MKTRYLGALGVAVLLTMPATGSASAELSLRQAIEQTVEQNHVLRVSAQNVRISEARTDVARAARAPAVSLRYSAQTGNDALDGFAARLASRDIVASDLDPGQVNHPGTHTLFSGGISLRYPLYTAGAIDAEIERASLGETAQRWRHRQDIQLAIFDTIQAYLRLQAALARVDVADDATAAAQRHAHTTRSLVRDDRTVQSDQLTAEVNLTAFTTLRTQAHTESALARDALRLTTGMEPVAQLNVPSLNIRIKKPSLPAIDDARTEAMQNRPDLRALERARESAVAQVRVAQAQRRPRFDLVADTSLHSDDPFTNEPAWRVRGLLTHKLYDGGRSRKAIAVAQAHASQIQYRIAARQREILTQVQSAYTLHHDASSRIDNAHGNVVAAKRNVSLIEERYGQGRTLLIDLLGAEQRLVEARYEELTAAHGLLVSVAVLRLATGNLDPNRPQTYIDLQP